MTDRAAEETAPFRAPCAFFMGDFNVGKSMLINALLRRETLFSSGEESRALPTFLTRSGHSAATFAALPPDGADAASKSHEEFISIHRDTTHLAAYGALAARLPETPFSRLVLVDTAGTSSDTWESVQIAELPGQEDALFVIVTDIEYWSAKHTMDFIAFHHEVFGDALLVVGNKADRLNANEIRRIHSKASRRMEAYGIMPAPRFIPLSARLEVARSQPGSEYRHRVKAEVRDLCDTGFDALRVALYEFEAAHAGLLPYPSFEQLLNAPLPASFIKTQEGSPQ